MAPKRDILQYPKQEGVEVTVKYIVKTAEANFKAVVQSLTGQDSPAILNNNLLNVDVLINPHSNSPEILSNNLPNVDVVINPHSNSLRTVEHGFLQERENVKKIKIEGESLYCMPSFVGFETGMFDSFSDDLGFQNYNDAFELPPSTISDLDMSWDSSLWSDGMSFSI